jgi:chromosome segregation ATPase
MVDSDGDSMDVSLGTVAGTLSALKTSVEEQFKQVDQQFKQVDERFKQVDLRFEQVDQRFEQVDHRFEQVDQRFEQVDRRFDAVEEQIRSGAETMRQLLELQDERIRAEGEKTRRHVDILWEQMKAERNLVLDLGLACRDEVTTLRASNAEEHSVFENSLADHEARLTRLEPME